MTEVRLAGVAKWFGRDDKRVHALDGVDLEVGAGEFVALIGPSGCGKSTLLRVVGGLLDADAGTVTVGGEHPDSARRHKRFGFVPQTPALLPWRSVRANVALLGQVNRRGADHALPPPEERAELLEEVGLGPFVDALPNELSGGLQQRVAIVRAVALGAPVLLMDEPFSALDEITRSEMRYLLLRLWAKVGATVLFVTHSIPEAVVLADRVVCLAARPGRITRVVDVPLDRPRTEAVEDTPAFHALVAEVRSALREGSGR